MTQRIQKWLNGGKYLEVDGLQIFYQVHGHGPDLLLLHGYPYNSYDFHLVVPELARSHRVVLFDFPGMGFSDKPRQHEYTFAGYAKVVNALARHLEIREADILAHDLGVSVAQELLAQQSESSFKFRSVAFMNGGLFTDVYRPRLIQRVLSQSPDWLGAFLSQRIGRKAVERPVVSLFGRDTKPSAELLDDFWSILNFKEGKAIAYRIGRLVFEKEKHQQRWHQAMRETKTPLCYICGPADPNSGRHMAERYRQHLPQSPVYFLSDTIGHWPQLEAPEEVLQQLGEFWRRFR
ncbi:alpha/beta fold hydrolase [Turneriella parva]|uniref:Alpha/beta hydrolase fold containing protein n=1 Tax=Turneriella parva (strain ATCC BAA-1111 / DSM 21527 / NCTC 11395 / H) TaxID=869212 RepID=I4B300_TURPD|nr:alpha/beta hydrolase [Turneriella parva]AFM11657.1 alpha/beta hydrolase fold containing protein [Turneriella parva DSM 21527]